MIVRMHDLPRPEIEAARQAITLLGGPVKAAARLGVPRYQTVQSWSRHGVPTEYCAAIERELAGAVTRAHLKPHAWRRIWPELADLQPTEQGV